MKTNNDNLASNDLNQIFQQTATCLDDVLRGYGVEAEPSLSPMQPSSSVSSINSEKAKSPDRGDMFSQDLGAPDLVSNSQSPESMARVSLWSYQPDSVMDVEPTLIQSEVGDGLAVIDLGHEWKLQSRYQYFSGQCPHFDFSIVLACDEVLGDSVSPATYKKFVAVMAQAAKVDNRFFEGALRACLALGSDKALEAFRIYCRAEALSWMNPQKFIPGQSDERLKIVMSLFDDNKKERVKKNYHHYFVKNHDTAELHKSIILQVVEAWYDRELNSSTRSEDSKNQIRDFFSRRGFEFFACDMAMIVLIESGGNSQAVSGGGVDSHGNPRPMYCGLMQASLDKYKGKNWRDPRVALQVGVEYFLNECLFQAKYNPEANLMRALSNYNMGPGATAGYVAGKRRLASVTREYVHQFMALQQLDGDNTSQNA